MAREYLTKKSLNVYGPLLLQNLKLEILSCNAEEQVIKKELREEAISVIKTDLIYNGQFMNSQKFKKIDEFKSCINSMGLEPGMFNKFIDDIVHLAYLKNCGEQDTQGHCGDSLDSRDLAGEIRNNKIDQAENRIIAFQKFGRLNSMINITENRIKSIRDKCMTISSYTPTKSEKLFCDQAKTLVKDLQLKKQGLENVAYKIVSKYPEVIEPVKMKSGRSSVKSRGHKHYFAMTGKDEVIKASEELAGVWIDDNLDKIYTIKNKDDAKALIEKSHLRSLLQPMNYTKRIVN